MTSCDIFHELSERNDNKSCFLQAARNKVPRNAFEKNMTITQ